MQLDWDKSPSLIKKREKTLQKTTLNITPIERYLKKGGLLLPYL